MYVEYKKARNHHTSLKVIAAILVFMMLPWLFIGHISQALMTSFEEPAVQPVSVPDFEPVPVAYPVVLQYVPNDLSTVEDWIQQHYPGSLVDLSMLQSIDRAAKEANVNLGILLGILVAEQSMLCPSVVGYSHALYYSVNPFDYGVWQGSPYPFAIGAYASAKGATSLAARSIESFAPGAWSAAQYVAWMGFFEDWYVQGVNAISAIGNWGQTVSFIWQSVAQYVVKTVPSWFDNVKTWIHNAVDNVVRWFTANKAQIYSDALVALGAILVVGAVAIVVGSGGTAVPVVGGALASLMATFDTVYPAALNAV